ncbi:MAG: hypothetical protein HOC91_07255 [Nitrospinaceae bacterium]|jgi:Na+/proline symporter|nr:hypothetical protein [Nitrospinaceae bacterium]MBT3821607.1 hypothetical protein [Nitrospinaceae bacterium]MBT4094526.1 hypothetical protein [Nitrospinaceae bacterium]MBT4430295.1 hypothetical protein [Nitrospinaceae bacterium]MBT5367830.1 hypothetical protein [Nitrospinaceae bacterium]
MKDSRKWARLLVCLAFHMILMGLISGILIHLYGLNRPEKILFLPSLLAAAVVGIFYTYDRKANRISESGNLAGALTGLRLWVDFSYPALDIGRWAYFGLWAVWGSYLANILVVLLVGVLAERRGR